MYRLDSCIQYKNVDEPFQALFFAHLTSSPYSVALRVV